MATSNFVPNRDFAAQLLTTGILALFMDAVANRGKDIAKDAVPVDTGNLRNTIEMKRITATGRRVQAGGGPAPYWHFVEFGAPGRGQAAQPFLRPIIEKLRLKR